MYNAFKKRDGLHPCGTPARLSALVLLGTWLWRCACRHLKNTYFTHENELTDWIHLGLLEKNNNLFLDTSCVQMVAWVPEQHINSWFMWGWWIYRRECISPHGRELQAFNCWGQLTESKGEFHCFHLDWTDYIRSSCVSLPQSAGDTLPGYFEAPGCFDIETDAVMKMHRPQQDHMWSTCQRLHQTLFNRRLGYCL